MNKSFVWSCCHTGHCDSYSPLEYLRIHFIVTFVYLSTSSSFSLSLFMLDLSLLLSLLSFSLSCWRWWWGSLIACGRKGLSDVHDSTSILGAANPSDPFTHKQKHKSCTHFVNVDFLCKEVINVILKAMWQFCCFHWHTCTCIFLDVLTLQSIFVLFCKRYVYVSTKYRMHSVHTVIPAIRPHTWYLFREFHCYAFYLTKDAYRSTAGATISTQH